MTGFWKAWLAVWWWSGLLLGVVLALGAFPETEAPARMLIGVLGADAQAQTVLDAQVSRFVVGVMGAVSIGWMMAIGQIMKLAETGGAPVWRGLVLGFSAWFVPDSIISAVTGFGINIIPNILLMVGILVPLLATGALKGAR